MNKGTIQQEIRKSLLLALYSNKKINKATYQQAQKNIEKSETSCIELRLCDGLGGVNIGEADTFIIAGMGGEVISGIIERGAEIVKDKRVTLILQPTTSPEFLRRFLCENGFSIIKEKAVFENGKIYSVMLVCFTGEIAEHHSSYYYIGELNRTDETSLKYIEKQLVRNLKCMQSLENIPSKTAEHEYYKSVVMGIREALKK